MRGRKKKKYMYIFYQGWIIVMGIKNHICIWTNVFSQQEHRKKFTFKVTVEGEEAHHCCENPFKTQIDNNWRNVFTCEYGPPNGRSSGRNLLFQQWSLWCLLGSCGALTNTSSLVCIDASNWHPPHNPLHQMWSSGKSLEQCCRLIPPPTHTHSCYCH